LHVDDSIDPVRDLSKSSFFVLKSWWEWQD
jgi:hypothetical protein